MEVIKINEFSLKDVILISSLPDMGKVGGLVTQHLLKHFNAKPSLRIIISDKPWVNQKNGLINIPKDEYLLSVDEKTNLVIFSGNNQPQEPSTVIELAERIISETKNIGKIKMVITTGGYMPVEHSENNSVFGVATNEKSIELLKQNKIPLLGNEVSSITWFNGLIMGKALENNIDAIGLFGEISDTDSEQFKAASNVVKKIQEFIKLAIDTDDLDKKNSKISYKSSKRKTGNWVVTLFLFQAVHHLLQSTNMVYHQHQQPKAFHEIQLLQQLLAQDLL